MSAWITDRLPTRADADEDCEVQALHSPGAEPEDGVFVDYRLIVPGQPWWSRHAEFCAAASMPAPAPAPARVVTVMAANDLCLYAACNDGTIWTVGALGGEWDPIAPIPQPETHDA